MKRSKDGCPYPNSFGSGFVVEREYDEAGNLVALYIQPRVGQGEIRRQPVNLATTGKPPVV